MASAYEVATATARSTSDDADAVNHLVCCRRSWDVTFCGMSTEDAPVNVVSDFICIMCLEEAIRLSGGSLEEGVCPLDGSACPDEAEIDVRISWETS